MGKYSRAIDKLQELSSDTSRIEIYRLIGDSHIKLNRPDSAEKYYLIGLEYTGDTLLNLQIMAQAFYDDGYLNRAADYCYRILAVHPHPEDIYPLMGSIYDKSGNYDSSFKYYEATLQTDSSSYDAFLGLTNAYFQKGNTDKAINILKRAKRFHPENPDLFFKIGFIYNAMKRKTQAAENMHHAVKLAPGFLQARYFLAEVFIDVEMLDSALVQCDSIIIIDSTYVPAYLCRARGYDKMDKPAMAESS